MTLTATASDVDGTVTRVEFYSGELKIGEAQAAPFTTLWLNPPSGVHMITAKAWDNRLGAGLSSPVTITIDPPPLGNGVGLSADYYDNIDFTGTVVHRTDPMVNFNWGGAPDPGIGADTFSVRWIGRVQPRFTETYTFYTVSDDGVRLRVNNQQLIDNWTDHGQTENSGVIALQAGNLYEIRMEYYENGGGATAQLLWSSPNTPKEFIPMSQLYLPAPSNLPPAVVVTSPPSGSEFVAGAPIEMIANAVDPEGSISRVEFYANSSKLGEVTATPYRLVWTNALAGAYSLRSVGVDNLGERGTSAPVNITVIAGYSSNVTLIVAGSPWKYRDSGMDLGSTWSLLGYNDSGWPAGYAQLGYGEGDEMTQLSFGTNAEAKHVTYYFRQSFTVSNLAFYTGLTLRLQCDDGAVVYLNGSEIYRQNMPDGEVGYQTFATNDVEGAAEMVWRMISIDPGYLVPGNNVVAVEVHQFSPQSDDLSFNAGLTGIQTFIAPYVITQPAAQAVTAGDDVELRVVAGGSGPLSYQWRMNSANLPGQNSPTLLLRNIQLWQQGNYQVVVSNTAGSAASANAFVTVTPPVLTPITFTQQPQGAILKGSTNDTTYGQTFSNFTFTVAVSGTKPIRLQWQKDGRESARGHERHIDGLQRLERRCRKLHCHRQQHCRRNCERGGQAGDRRQPGNSATTAERDGGGRRHGDTFNGRQRLPDAAWVPLETRRR